MTSLSAADVERAGPTPVGAPQSTLTDLFPTPLLVWRWEDAALRKPQLLAAIRQRRAANPGIVRTNRNGWHSETDLPGWEEPGVAELVRWAAQCVGQGCRSGQTEASETHELPGPWRVNGWANVNPPGAHNVSHTHAQRNWHWSACYYVDLPDLSGSDQSGALVLEERGTGLKPRGGEPWSRQHRYVPREGELVVFPAWLYHRVEPHDGPSDRVTIAFNFHHPALEPSRLWEHRPRWWWRRFPELFRRMATYRGTQDWSAGATPLGHDVIPEA